MRIRGCGLRRVARCGLRIDDVTLRRIVARRRRELNRRLLHVIPALRCALLPLAGTLAGKLRTLVELRFGIAGVGLDGLEIVRISSFACPQPLPPQPPMGLSSASSS